MRCARAHRRQRSAENAYDALKKMPRPDQAARRASSTGNRPRRGNPPHHPGAVAPDKNNPVLIGEPGVGKTAIVEGLALRISMATCRRA